jgi:type I restriction enzyme S subunit
VTLFLGADHWKPAVLKDLVFFQRGFDIIKAHQKDGDIPVISSSGISSWHNEAMAKGPGVVIGRKGTLGTVHYSEGDYWPHDTTLWSKSLNGNSPRFVYYALRFLGLERFNVGGANPTLNRNHIHGLPIHLADRPTQDEIASILSAYDDLIENNRRRITLLEEAARMLYREWFVHFRFPGHEHVKIIDNLPAGWEWNRIAHTCSFLGRGISPNYNDEGQYTVVSQKCVRDRLLSLAPARRQSREYNEDRALKHLDVLINSTGTGTLGRVAQCWFEPEATTFDSHVTVARPSGEVDPFWFGYALLELQRVFEGMGDGATNQKELSTRRIAKTRLPVPPRPLQTLFAAFSGKTSTQIQTLTTQNEKLAQARDLLLPRLMNGKIAV